MFAEVPFGGDEGVCSEVQDSALQPRGVTVAGGSGGFVRLHRPGEDGFACVAGTTGDVNALYDARHVSGDSWLSHECHCLRCETVLASSKLSRLQRKDSVKEERVTVVVVLLDLDNYGFNHFKSVPPRGKGCSGFDVINHIFVWCFFGSCFVRYHGSYPDAESVCKRVPKSESAKVSGSRRGVRRTVWQRLVAEGRCHFTPCGGQKQAVDDVILQVTRAMMHLPLIVLSGDRGLLQAAPESRRVVGRKASRDLPTSDVLSELDIISAAEHGKRFLPVWLELSEKVRRILQE